jgi:hypothetical protein
LLVLQPLALFDVGVEFDFVCDLVLLAYFVIVLYDLGSRGME